MFVVDLVCHDGHLFEGWYDSRDAFDDARAAASLSCPVCGVHDVEQRPSFRGIVSRSSPQKTPPKKAATPTTTTTPEMTTTPPPPMPIELQRALSQIIKMVKANTEDAGAAFAARALAMHKGDEEPAAIHGTSTAEERALLVEEGVEFVGIPVPEIDEN